MNRSEPLTNLKKGTQRLVSTFPMETVCILLFYGCIWVLINKYDQTWNIPSILITRLYQTSGLVFLVSLSVTLLTTGKQAKTYLPLLKGIVFIAVFTLVFIFLDTPGKLLADLRLLFLAFSFHFLIAFSLFSTTWRNRLFWTFNKLLFLRILSAFLYSIVLIAGLNLALLSIHLLFNADVKPEFYENLDAFLLIVFNTFYFLAGIPLTTEELESKEYYPTGLRYFTQFVLIPLVSIYFIILISYTVKIIFLFTLPKGWVSTLILLYAFAGILSILLIFPLRNVKEHTWINLFNRLFFWTLIPLNILLYMAIYYRISDYGFTEYRFAVLLLSFWLSVISAYFIIDRDPEIKSIPISLFLIGMICLFFPLNAFNTSRLSQMHRLKTILQTAHSHGQKIDQKKLMPAFAIIDFLYGRYSYAAFQPLTSVNLEHIYLLQTGKMTGNITDYTYNRDQKMKDTVAAILKIIDPSLTNKKKNIPDTVLQVTSARTTFWQIGIPKDNLIEINGYETMYLNAYPYDFTRADTISTAGLLVLKRNKHQKNLILRMPGDSLSFNLSPLMNDTISVLSQALLTGAHRLTSSSVRHQGIIQFTSATFQLNGDTLIFTNSTLVLLLKKRKN